MQKKYFYNSTISSLLVLSIVLVPFHAFPKEVKAQSISGYVSGLAPMILTLPQCKNVIGSGISSLFSGGEDLFNSANLADEAKPLGDIVNSAASKFDSVNVNISGTAEGKAILETREKTEKIEASTASIRENSTCIQSIGRLIIKMLLQKLTVSTVNWINSGFDGSPAFIQDTGKFFGDIAKNEILQFGLEINNPELFPFGKAWMQNTAIAFNNKFQDNARYSLNELIQETTPEYSAATFQEDFSQGGWNAWTALTQVPANNPLGFKLMADNEIQRRLAGTTQSTAEYVHDALAQANGFLGDQRCAEPKGVTKEQNDAYLRGESADTTVQPRKCERWEYVTPGKLISEAATTAINYQNNAYLDVEDLNDAVAAVLDALLSQFSSNIMEKGFANLTDQGSDGNLIFSSDAGFNFTSQTEKDFSPVHLTSSWLSANPNFNIRTGLTQALADEQRTYSDKLALQNKELSSTTDGREYRLDEIAGISNAYGLIPTINQLDFCIPGPHPGWENEVQRTLSDIVIPGASSSYVGTSFFTTIISSIPIIGGVLGSLFGDDEPSALELSLSARKQYSDMFRDLTGYHLRVRESTDAGTLKQQENNVSSNLGLMQVFNKILNRYINIMNKTYFSSPEILPNIAEEAALNFNQLVGYSQMIKNNEDKISFLKTTVNILGEIKSAVDELNLELESGQITEEEYENNLKPQINAFGRLSSSMVNGSDIADADNTSKQIVDKKNYIYDNLLKGPYGCETFLADPNNIKNFPSVGTGNNDWGKYNVNSVKRMSYPFQIFYDYNKFENGAALPDPWTSCDTSNPPESCNNKMPITGNTLGPGFLSFVLFSNYNAAEAERLDITDLVDNYHQVQDVPLGKLGQDDRLRFENIINIY